MTRSLREVGGNSEMIWFLFYLLIYPVGEVLIFIWSAYTRVFVIEEMELLDREGRM